MFSLHIVLFSELLTARPQNLHPDKCTLFSQLSQELQPFNFFLLCSLQLVLFCLFRSLYVQTGDFVCKTNVSVSQCINISEEFVTIGEEKSI